MYAFGSSGYSVGLQADGGAGLKMGGMRATGADLEGDALQRLYEERYPPQDGFADLADAGTNLPAVRIPARSKVMTFANGAASTLASWAFGGANPLNMSPQERAAWRQANPNAGFGQGPNVQWDVDLGSMSATRVIGSTQPMGEALKDVFSLGFRPVGTGLGTFIGGMRTANDSSLSLGTQFQGAYDAGSNSFSVPTAALMAGAPLLKFRVEGPTYEIDASLPIGSKRLQFNQPESPSYQPVRNSASNIDGREYSGHAIDRMQDRGIMPSVVQNAIQTGVATPSRLGSTVYYDPINNVSVVLNAQGKAITVKYGK